MLKKLSLISFSIVNQNLCSKYSIKWTDIEYMCYAQFGIESSSILCSITAIFSSVSTVFFLL